MNEPVSKSVKQNKPTKSSGSVETKAKIDIINNIELLQREYAGLKVPKIRKNATLATLQAIYEDCVRQVREGGVKEDVEKDYTAKVDIRNPQVLERIKMNTLNGVTTLSSFLAVTGMITLKRAEMIAKFVELINSEWESLEEDFVGTLESMPFLIPLLHLPPQVSLILKLTRLWNNMSIAISMTEMEEEFNDL